MVGIQVFKSKFGKKNNTKQIPSWWEQAGNCFCQSMMGIIKFSKLSGRLKHDQVNRKEKPSVVLTGLKTEWENLYFFISNSDFLLLLSQFCAQILCASDLSQFLLLSLGLFIPWFIFQPHVAVSWDFSQLKFSVSSYQYNGFPCVQPMVHKALWI